MNRLTVVVDPYLEEILPRYMEVLQKELTSQGQAVNAGDGETLCMLGHKLREPGLGMDSIC